MKINVIVHASSKKPRIELSEQEQLHVYVHKPAREGAANKEVISALAVYFKVSKTQVILIRGEKSKLKTFEICS